MTKPKDEGQGLKSIPSLDTNSRRSLTREWVKLVAGVTGFADTMWLQYRLLSLIGAVTTKVMRRLIHFVLWSERKYQRASCSLGEEISFCNLRAAILLHNVTFKLQKLIEQKKLRSLRIGETIGEVKDHFVQLGLVDPFDLVLLDKLPKLLEEVSSTSDQIYGRLSGLDCIAKFHKDLRESGVSGDHSRTGLDRQ